ncbi:unnamed protein product [Leuciscus chuanchicus]
MPQTCDAETQWEDPSVSDHNYTPKSKFNVKPSTSEMGTQCIEPVPLYITLLRNDHLCQLYTGFTLDAFHSVAEHLTPSYTNSFQLHTWDQLLITLMKLRLNLLQGDLAERFGVSQSIVSKVISCWLDIMEEKMRCYIPWLPRETIQATMPQCFREKFPNTTCVIDCSETPLQKPRNLDSRGEFYSHYYGQNTIKYLVSIAPCGLIMFISPAYGGRSSLQDVRVMHGADCGSDHYMVRAKVRLRLKRPPTSLKHGKKPNVALLQDPKVCEAFQIDLQNRFNTISFADENGDPETSVDRAMNELTELISDCTSAVCPPSKRRSKPWITGETLALIEQRKKNKLANQDEYRRLHKIIRKRLKKERAAYWEELAEEMETAANRKEFRTLYSTIWRLARKNKPLVNNIKDSTGKFLRSNEERLNRWKEYFQDLLNHPALQGPTADPDPVEDLSTYVDDLEPSLPELRVAIKSLKNNKAPGVDSVVAEALKHGREVLEGHLNMLLGLIWRTEVIPTAWKWATIIPTFKKGDKSECKNYRGISLLSIIGKVFMKIIHRRMLKRREEAAREEQAGFRPDRSCCDQIFSLRQLLEERIRCGKRTALVFIDFSAAFDSVHRPALWNTLRAEGYPPKIIRLLQNTYEGSTSHVRVQGGVTSDFQVNLFFC